MTGETDGQEQTSQTADALAATRWPRPLRRQQQQALEALERAWRTKRRRACVVLPPGAGKTLVGLEGARRLGRRTVVLSPNTAIQGQWVSSLSRFIPATASAGTDVDLRSDVTALTKQALASFDPDAEVDEGGLEKAPAKGRSRTPLLEQLHPNGQALVTALRAAGPVTLILDEYHHLLEVWGRLLAGVLDTLPDAMCWP